MYKKYIDLGFKRTDLDYNVEFRNTGYYGYCLSKKVNKKLSISVCSGDLEKPKLYIKKYHNSTFHIIEINFEIVIDILYKEPKEVHHTMMA